MALRQPPIQERIANTLLGQVWVQWFLSVYRRLVIVNDDNSITLPSLADGDAANSTLYYSTTQGKLVWKDSGGTVNDLY